MRHFRLPAIPVPLPLFACCAALTCLGAASALWTLNQFSPSSWLTVAVGQKFSPPADYFYAVRLRVWLHIGAIACLAALFAWRLHVAGAAPVRSAIAAVRRMACGDLSARFISTGDGIQNNELLSTMQ